MKVFERDGEHCRVCDARGPQASNRPQHSVFVVVDEVEADNGGNGQNDVRPYPEDERLQWPKLAGEEKGVHIDECYRPVQDQVGPHTFSTMLPSVAWHIDLQ